MLDTYAEKRLAKCNKTPDLRNVTICPYCMKIVQNNLDAEYLKMKSGHETFFHRSCLAKEIERRTNTK